jgi:hypothetical protein
MQKTGAKIRKGGGCMRLKTFIAVLCFLMIGSLSGSVFAYDVATQSSWWFVATGNGAGVETVGLTIANLRERGTNDSLFYSTKQGSAAWSTFSEVKYLVTTLPSGTLLDFNLRSGTGTGISFQNLNSATYQIFDSGDGTNNAVEIYWNGTKTASLILGADNTKVSAVPIPPSALLMGSGLLGLVGVGLRRQRLVG